MRLSTILTCASAALFAFAACADSNANPPTNAAAYESARATPCNYAPSPPETTTVVQIHGDEQALPCGFVWRKILTLDNASFDVDAALATVLQNSRGEYAVRGRNNIIGLLDSTGKLIRTLGRDGSGPGEFRFATVVAMDALDTVYVYDPYQKRLTVVSPTLSEVVRTVNTPELSFEHSFMVLPASQLLVGGYSDTTFNTLRVLGTGGSIQRAWNVDTMSANRAERNRRSGTRELPGNRDRVMTRWLAANSNGDVLVARRNSYIIESWNTKSQLARTFTRTVAWFPTLHQDQFPGSISDSTPAQIYGVGNDSSTGNVVVKILVTARKWKPTANGTTTAEGTASSQPVAVGDATNYFDTVFEAFDPRTGQLTASARLPGTFGAINNALMFQTLRELPNGDVVVDIIQLALAAHKNP